MLVATKIILGSIIVLLYSYNIIHSNPMQLASTIPHALATKLLDVSIVAYLWYMVDHDVHIWSNIFLIVPHIVSTKTDKELHPILALKTVGFREVFTCTVDTLVWRPLIAAGEGVSVRDDVDVQEVLLIETIREGLVTSCKCWNVFTLHNCCTFSAVSP